MPDELADLLETAIYKEIVSQAFYTAGMSKTQDSGARALMKELAREELKHTELLKNLKEREWKKQDWHQEKIADLMISDYLTGESTLEGAGLQDTLVFAMKREQQAVEFYSKMTALIRDESATLLCERLVHEELKHKLRLETFYDDFFYVED